MVEKIIHKVIIGLGANVSEKKGHLSAACSELAGKYPDFTASSIYTTPAVGSTAGGPDYANAVAQFSTCDDYNTLKDSLREMETRYGRRREPGTLVALDIDIVRWDDEVLRPRDMAQDYIRIGLAELGTLFSHDE